MQSMLLLSLILTSFRFSVAIPISQQLSTSSEVLGPYWMHFLPDDIPLNQINIPATHDTAATERGTLITKNLVQTQILSITKQLMMGIRLLDLRLRWKPKKNKFDLHHGLQSFPVDFEGALNEIKQFLKQYDTETVIILIWPEKYIPSEDKREFLERKEETRREMIRWINNIPHDPNLNTIVAPIHHVQLVGSHKLTVPTLGETRGKIVIMTLDIDPRASQQSGYTLSADENTIFPDIFNKAKTEVPLMKKEWGDVINDHIQRTGHQQNIFYGVSSGATSGLQGQISHGPEFWAHHMNPFVAKRLQEEVRTAYGKGILPPNPANLHYLGIIATDFVSEDSPIPALTVFTNVDIWRKLETENKAYSDEAFVALTITNVPATLLCYWHTGVVKDYRPLPPQQPMPEQPIPEQPNNGPRILNLAGEDYWDMMDNDYQTQQSRLYLANNNGFALNIAVLVVEVCVIGVTCCLISLLVFGCALIASHFMLNKPCLSIA